MKNKRFTWQPFSKKQLQIMTWWCDNSPVKDYDGIIADGAVRSGKTISMAPSFVNWAMECYEECDFALCGKTVGSLRRNVINNLKNQCISLGYEWQEKRTDNIIVITKNKGAKNETTNYFYTFGGKDESSQDLIQGMTLAGVFFDEVALMLDEVEKGDNLTDRQKRFHDKTKIRDVAIMTLMLGTGIRVSECIGLNIDDVDFKNDGIRIHRKGGKETTVYFGDEVEKVLTEYIDYRKLQIPLEGHENALFLSLQMKRISVKSVEQLVQKYARIVTPLKKITPHKLRSTYGTNLYRETGDIYLVADVLGHNDVNTTRKHYAAIEDARKRSARNAVKLRET